VVVIIRERGGASVPAVFNSERKAASFIRARVAKGTTVHADEARSWDGLHDYFGMKRIDQGKAYNYDGACIHQAGIFQPPAPCRDRHSPFTLLAPICSAMRRRRRVSNGDQVSRLAALPMERGKSIDFTGYWQRHIA
jgi:hypothetical protein